jgi:hypothetical protein
MPTHTPSERRKRRAEAARGESNLARARRAGRTAPGAGRTAAPKRKTKSSMMRRTAGAQGSAQAKLLAELKRKKKK